MEISISSNRVIINGNIKSISDFQSIKENIDKLIVHNNNIVLEIKESLSITSSVIGYLNKLVLKDNIKISMLVNNSQLLELLNDLNLSSVFNARKV